MSAYKRTELRNLLGAVLLELKTKHVPARQWRAYMRSLKLPVSTCEDILIRADTSAAPALPESKESLERELLRLMAAWQAPPPPKAVLTPDSAAEVSKLYEIYVGLVKRIVSRNLVFDLDDTMQEAWRRISEAYARKPPSPEKIEHFVARIAKRASIDELTARIRKHGDLQYVESDFDLDIPYRLRPRDLARIAAQSSSEYDDLPSDEEVHRLQLQRRALEMLKPEERAVLTRHVEIGTPAAAKEAGVNVNTFSSRVHWARKHLKENFSRLLAEKSK